jgi:hypothetical protein
VNWFASLSIHCTAESTQRSYFTPAFSLPYPHPPPSTRPSAHQLAAHATPCPRPGAFGTCTRRGAEKNTKHTERLEAVSGRSGGRELWRAVESCGELRGAAVPQRCDGSVNEQEHSHAFLVVRLGLAGGWLCLIPY